MLRPENLPHVPDIAEALADVINTNFPPSQIDQLLSLAQSVESEPSRSWVFKDPQWADFMTRRETGGRQVLIPRLDAIGALSIELFGERSLYYSQQPGATPVASPSPTASPSPQPSASPSCGRP